MQNITKTITTALLSNLSWFDIPFLDPPTPDTAHQFRVLDYACGPGLLTSIFRPYASEILGADLSEKMVERYNATYSPPASSQGVPPPGATCHAVVGDLLAQPKPSDSLSGQEYFGFDMVAVGAAMHHFSDVELATARLVERLKPGGMLVVVDFVEWKKGTGGEPEKGAAHTIAHRGFSEGGMRELFAGAGLQGFGWWVLEESVTVESGGDHAHEGERAGQGHGRPHEGHGQEAPANEEKKEVEKWICVVKGRKPEK